MSVRPVAAMPLEAHYSLTVDRRGADPIVTVYSHGRIIARRTIRTFGECASLGLLLTDPSTPVQLVAES